MTPTAAVAAVEIQTAIEHASLADAADEAAVDERRVVEPAAAPAVTEAAFHATVAATGTAEAVVDAVVETEADTAHDDEVAAAGAGGCTAAETVLALVDLTRKLVMTESATSLEVGRVRT